MMVVGLVAGLMAGACTALEVGEVAPGDSEADVIRDDDPHLPGSCNGIACDTPTTPRGDNPDQCSGCDCMPSPQECRSCQIHCRTDWYRCVGHGGSAENCDAVFGNACEEACHNGVNTCACRSH